MSAEVICVGTELLLGDVLNTNCQYLAIELAKLGIPHYHQTVVGDNLQRINSIIDIAASRASILIFTGGLGPTPDDLTTEAIAKYFDTPLVEKPEIIEDISTKFAALGRKMSPSNYKQALIPEGATILPNPSGTAPGIIWQPRPNLSVLTFPGVPAEMQLMWEQSAIPYLKSIGWGKEIIYSRTLRFRGIGESALAEKVADFLNLANPTVAPYASKGEVRLRLSAKASSQAEAIATIAPIAKAIKEIAKDDYFGTDNDTLPAVVGALLRSKGQTLGAAESCTGGGLGGLISTVPGSSDYFMGGVVAYENWVKASLLGVKEEDLLKFGAVSSTVAAQMATGVQELLQSNWAISITGIAGPGGGTEDKPVGLVYVGLADPAGKVETFKYLFGQNRGRSLIRYLSACNSLDRLRRRLLQK